MGEHMTLDGKPYKLGILEDLYYVRFADLARWVTEGRARKEPGNLDPAAYLQGRHRFRFPFPDEDDAPDGPARCQFYWEHRSERGLLLPAPTAVLDKAEHMQVQATIERPAPELSHVTWYLPCPVGPDTDADKHTEATPGYVLLTQQRPYAGALWPVVRCPYCGVQWRLEPASGALWVAHIREFWAGGLPLLDATMELIARIEAGYLTPTGAPGEVEEVTL